ncbi:hypothetical protein SNEBB_001428 [Seison nebaliae]|nr:hypothetical protein SNEBB_001428 [Seison nebaliae]
MTHVFVLPSEKDLVFCGEFSRTIEDEKSHSEKSETYSKLHGQRSQNPYDRYFYCLKFFAAKDSPIDKDEMLYHQKEEEEVEEPEAEMSFDDNPTEESIIKSKTESQISKNNSNLAETTTSYGTNEEYYENRVREEFEGTVMPNKMVHSDVKKRVFK